MIKIFIPELKGKRKTSIRGFWRNESGKVYYDYLTSQDNYRDENNIQGLTTYLDNLKKFYQQECIAYKDNDKLKIFYSKDKIDVLNNSITKPIDRNNRKNLKDTLKNWLKEYNGVTVYINRENYILESYY